MSKPPQPPVDGSGDGAPNKTRRSLSRTSSLSSQSTSSGIDTELNKKEDVSDDGGYENNQNVSGVDVKSSEVVSSMSTSRSTVKTVSEASVSLPLISLDNVHDGAGNEDSANRSSHESEVPTNVDATAGEEEKKVPAASVNISSPPRPTRLVHSGVRTKDFFNNLPVQHNSRFHDVKGSSNMCVIDASPLARPTENENSFQKVEERVVDVVTPVTVDGDVSSVLNDISTTSCSEDGTEITENLNSTLPDQGGNVCSEMGCESRESEDSIIPLCSLKEEEENTATSECRNVPASDITPLKEELPEGINTSNEGKTLDDESICDVNLTKPSENREEASSPNSEMDDKTNTEISSEWDKENVPPTLLPLNSEDSTLSEPHLPSQLGVGESLCRKLGTFQID